MLLEGVDNKGTAKGNQEERQGNRENEGVIQEQSQKGGDGA